VPCARLVEEARGCDVLIHEVYSWAGLQGRSPEWQEYHQASHTSTRELAEVANQVRPRLLILYHQLFWGASEGDLLAEIRETYDGPVACGRDLEVY
jgi:ribonuclease BN (tRNA processing enzyme)